VDPPRQKVKTIRIKSPASQQTVQLNDSVPVEGAGASDEESSVSQLIAEADELLDETAVVDQQISWGQANISLSPVDPIVRNQNRRRIERELKEKFY
jgi:hypothetical protein